MTPAEEDEPGSKVGGGGGGRALPSPGGGLLPSSPCPSVRRSTLPVLCGAVGAVPCPPRCAPQSFAVRSLGWVEMSEEELAPGRSSVAVNNCIRQLSLHQHDAPGAWGGVSAPHTSHIPGPRRPRPTPLLSLMLPSQGRAMLLLLQSQTLKLVDPQDQSLLHAQPVASIRVWGVGRDSGRWGWGDSWWGRRVWGCVGSSGHVEGALAACMSSAEGHMAVPECRGWELHGTWGGSVYLGGCGGVLCVRSAGSWCICLHVGCRGWGVPCVWDVGDPCACWGCALRVRGPGVGGSLVGWVPGFVLWGGGAPGLADSVLWLSPAALAGHPGRGRAAPQPQPLPASCRAGGSAVGGGVGPWGLVGGGGPECRRPFPAGTLPTWRGTS